MAAQAAAVQAPARTVGKWDSSAEGVSGLESSDGGASVVERVLGVAETNRCEPVQTGGVTGSVSDQTSRLAPRPITPSAGHVRSNVCRTALAGSGGSWSQRVGTASDVPPLEVGDAVYGYPAPSLTALVRRSHKRAGEGAAAEASVGTVQAGRSRMEGSRGCSLTISRLQRLVRSAFFWLAGSAFGWCRYDEE